MCGQLPDSSYWESGSKILLNFIITTWTGRSCQLKTGQTDIKQSKKLADASGQGRERRSGPRVMELSSSPLHQLKQTYRGDAGSSVLREKIWRMYQSGNSKQHGAVCWQPESIIIDLHQLQPSHHSLDNTTSHPGS